MSEEFESEKKKYSATIRLSILPYEAANLADAERILNEYIDGLATIAAPATLSWPELEYDIYEETEEAR